MYEYDSYDSWPPAAGIASAWLSLQVLAAVLCSAIEAATPGDVTPEHVECALKPFAAFFQGGC